MTSISRNYTRNLQDGLLETIEQFKEQPELLLMLTAYRLEKAIKRGLSNYEEFGTKYTPEREPIITRLFELLDQLFGYKWNRGGSFTNSAAASQYVKDVRLSLSNDKISVEVDGKISDLEEGVYSLDGMNRFVNSIWFFNRVSGTERYRNKLGQYAGISLRKGASWTNSFISSWNAFYSSGDSLRRYYVARPIQLESEQLNIDLAKMVGEKARALAKLARRF